MLPKLVIEQVGNYMIVYAQIPAWSVAFSYASIGVIGLWLYLRNNKTKKKSKKKVIELCPQCNKDHYPWCDHSRNCRCEICQTDRCGGNEC